MKLIVSPDQVRGPDGILESDRQAVCPDAFSALIPGATVYGRHLPSALDTALTAAPGLNVYAGTPDSRQSSDTTLPTSRFRPRYRALTDAEKSLHDAIKAKAAELEALFEQVPAGRYLSLGFTDLESGVSWAIKQLTA